jgi:hypothetical protein
VSDDVLSALIDRQVEQAEAASARAHLDQCAACQTRFAELRAVVGLLGRMPVLEPRRSFRIGPVPLPSNVRRLSRWYAVARGATASMAAVFVLLVAGNVYVQSIAPPSQQTAVTAERAVPAQAPARDAGGPGNFAARPAVAGEAALRSGPAADPSDQVAAATSVQLLPTLSPTSAVAPAPRPVGGPVTRAPESEDRVDGWRTAAGVAGLLALVALLAAVVIRYRLRRARLAAIHVPE